MSDTIKDLEIEMLDKEQEKQNIEDKMKAIGKDANEFALQKAEQKDKEFSNEKKRQLKIDEMLSDNQEYQELDAKLQDLKVEMKKLRIEIDYQKRQFQREYGSNGELVGILDKMRQDTKSIANSMDGATGDLK